MGQISAEFPCALRMEGLQSVFLYRIMIGCNKDIKDVRNEHLHGTSIQKNFRLNDNSNEAVARGSQSRTHLFG